MANVFAMCISFKMFKKKNIYIYRKQRVPGIWRTSNQSKIEHRWVRTNPTNQGRIYDYVFSSNRKKVNSFFSIYGNLKKKTQHRDFSWKGRGKRSSGIFLSFVLFRDGTWLRLSEAGACFGPWSQGFPGELSVHGQVNHLPPPTPGPRTPTPPEENSRPDIFQGLYRRILTISFP